MIPPWNWAVAPSGSQDPRSASIFWRNCSSDPQRCFLSDLWGCQKSYNVRPPSDVCWLTKAPVTIDIIININKYIYIYITYKPELLDYKPHEYYINHSYWSYWHQLNAILGASHCRIVMRWGKQHDMDLQSYMNNHQIHFPENNKNRIEGMILGWNSSGNHQLNAVFNGDWTIRHWDLTTYMASLTG